MILDKLLFHDKEKYESFAKAESRLGSHYLVVNHINSGMNPCGKGFAVGTLF